MINDPSQESLVGCADHAEAGLTEDKSHDPREFDLGKQITTNELKAENAGLQVSTSFNDKCTSEPRFEGLDLQIEGLDQQIEASELQLNASESTLEFSKLTINAFQRQTEALNTKFESFTFTNDREVKALALQHEALALKLEAIEVENERNKALAEENKNGIKALEQRSDALEQNYEAYQLFDLDDGEQRTRPKPLDNSNLEEQSTPKKDWLYFNSWPLVLAALFSILSIICLIILLCLKKEMDKVNPFATCLMGHAFLLMQVIILLYNYKKKCLGSPIDWNLWMGALLFLYFATSLTGILLRFLHNKDAMEKAAIVMELGTIFFITFLAVSLQTASNARRERTRG